MVLLITFLSVSAVSAVDDDVSDDSLNSNIDDIGVSELSDKSVYTNDASDAGFSAGEDNNLVKKLGESSVGNFSELNDIVSGKKSGVITLDKNYKNNNESDFKDGITIIGNDLVIDGNGITIDANHLGTIFTIIGNNITIKNINFINGNKVNKYAGALTLYATNVTVTDCNFSNFVGDTGGAIEVHNHNVIITGCDFDNCTSAAGGAIDITDINVTVNDCRFKHCNAYLYGGAICSTQNNSLISECLFEDCLASMTGGALYLASNETTGEFKYYVSNCNFSNCASGSGGAILVGESTTQYISGCTFTYNIATNYGGAIYVVNSAVANIDNSEFTYNKATNGSAIYVVSEADITDSKFSDNLAKSFDLYLEKNIDSNGTVLVALEGGDNVMNAIYLSGELSVDDATISKSSNATDAVKRKYAPYQNIIVKLYDFDNNLIGNFSSTLDENGEITYSYKNDLKSAYKFEFEHPEDTYYTYKKKSVNYIIPTDTNSSNVGGIVNSTIKVPVDVYIEGTDDKIPIENFTVFYYLGDDEEEYEANVIDGFFNLTLPKDEGVYELLIFFDGYKNYGSSGVGVYVTARETAVDTNVSADNVSGNVGSDKSIVVNVLDKDGSLVTEGNVSITLNNVTYDDVAVVDGKATVVVTLPNKAGNYTANVEYKGTDQYNPSSGSANVEVVPNVPNVVVTDASAKYSMDPVFKSKVTFNGADVSSKGNVSYVIYDAENNTVSPSDLVGGETYYVEARFTSFDKDVLTDAISEKKAFTVDPLNTFISVDGFSGKAGSTKHIVVDIVDENGNPVTSGYVLLSINNKEYYAPVKNGKAIFDIVLPNKAGNYTLFANYIGNCNYSYSGSMVYVEVTKDNTNNNNTNNTNGGNDVGPGVVSHNDNSDEFSEVSTLPKTGSPLLALLVALLILPILRRKQ